MVNIRKLEADLWESADLLRAGSKLTSSQYCMPVLALLFLRYAYSRFKMVEAELLKNRPSRGGRVMPVEASDFAAKSALYLPREAQFDYLVNLSDDQPLGEAVNVLEPVQGVMLDPDCESGGMFVQASNPSLTPDAYVGVAEVEDDGVDFHKRMSEIHTELSQLNAEANVLMSEIMKEWNNLNTK